MTDAEPTPEEQLHQWATDRLNNPLQQSLVDYNNSLPTPPPTMGEAFAAAIELQQSGKYDPNDEIRNQINTINKENNK